VSQSIAHENRTIELQRGQIEEMCKVRMRIEFAFLVLVLLNIGCNRPTTSPSAVSGTSAAAATTSAPPATATPTPSIAPTPTVRFSDQTVAAAVKASPFGIADVLIYTAETDTNKLLGRPGQYTGKVSWNDLRVTSKNYDSTIELFADRASMDARFTYVDAIIKSSPLFLQYMYRNDGRLAILRLPKDLTPLQAQAYADWFANL